MFSLPKSIETLIAELQRLPGVGPKTASRLAFYLLRSGQNLHESLGNALINMKNGVNYCQECFGLTENNVCLICSDNLRQKNLLCVVEEVLDVVAIEETHAFKGLYHVLHGFLSPLDGIGPSDLKINELKERIMKKNADGENISEIILATNASVEGEATANFISQILKPFNLKTTRLARGIPTGGNLEYIDKLTLQRAMEGRGEF
ncbi:recombination protein RecR [Candidatus Peregrinibacteria bacterium RIFOXYA12_FULL_33_12]|nr:MAG: recombination protein RecR [Candidatus Peregrinibacteria bacterium RIFOXYA2_FULL_33_21]OGJ46430.1 MAG: recombination protein RecR [Candidatus Peregrinibacteria bacterium RIFOXYA12_FULL_33_12]OGJ50259.1 MAG: recombination protein RecR [Candidatus Peregrinibacteria bacterium RIFOXYB2_FULL_33_20]